MPEFASSGKVHPDPQHSSKVSARATFTKYFGDDCLETAPWSGRRGRLEDEEKWVPEQMQPEIAKQVLRLRNMPSTIRSRFIERHSEIFENPIVDVLTAVASVWGGGYLGHWYQDGTRRFEWLHPSLGGIIGGVAGLFAGLAVLQSCHSAMVQASCSAERYEKSVVAADVLISGYITEPSVQRQLLDAVKEASIEGGGWPEAVRFKLLEIRACCVLADGVEKPLP
jgi:hypothetical protein